MPGRLNNDAGTTTEPVARILPEMSAVGAARAMLTLPVRMMGWQLKTADDKCDVSRETHAERMTKTCRERKRQKLTGFICCDDLNMPQNNTWC